MSERPTPETDALSFRFIDGAGVECEAVPSEFVRLLERERDEAREDAHHNAARANANAAECCRAWRERNEAREALENHAASTIHTCHDKCKRPMCVLRRERDEAREKAERYRLEANAMMIQRDEARNLVDHYREQKDLLPISWDV